MEVHVSYNVAVTAMCGSFATLKHSTMNPVLVLVLINLSINLMMIAGYTSVHRGEVVHWC